MLYQFWRHGRSGEVYAVQCTEDGEVLGVCGPLHYSEVRVELLDAMDYSTEDVEWMRDHQDEFVLVE